MGSGRGAQVDGGPRVRWLFPRRLNFITGQQAGGRRSIEMGNANTQNCYGKPKRLVCWISPGNQQLAGSLQTQHTLPVLLEHPGTGLSLRGSLGQPGELENLNPEKKLERSAIEAHQERFPRGERTTNTVAWRNRQSLLVAVVEKNFSERLQARPAVGGSVRSID